MRDEKQANHGYNRWENEINFLLGSVWNHWRVKETRRFLNSLPIASSLTTTGYDLWITWRQSQRYLVITVDITVTNSPEFFLWVQIADRLCTFNWIKITKLLEYWFLLTGLVGGPEWNQNEYASIREPFPLKSWRKGKVNQIITPQTMLPNDYSRDFTFRVTQ